VRLISGHDGVASAAGGAKADVRDGRVIVFISGDRTLLPADLTHCNPELPVAGVPVDRTPTATESSTSPWRPRLALVSAVDAGVVPLRRPGRRHTVVVPAVSVTAARSPVTDATNLLPSKRAGGGGERDGDLLVAEFVLGSIRRVLDGADTTGVPGAHGDPALSKTGQVIAFDTMAAAAIPGAELAGGAEGRAVVTVESTPQLSLAALDCGTVLLGFESTALYATVLDAGPAAFEPSVVDPRRPTSRSPAAPASGHHRRRRRRARSTSPSIRPSRAFEATLSVRGVGAGGGSVSTAIEVQPAPRRCSPIRAVSTLRTASSACTVTMSPSISRTSASYRPRSHGSRSAARTPTTSASPARRAPTGRSIRMRAARSVSSSCRQETGIAARS
jgi:hypothetical protein